MENLKKLSQMLQAEKSLRRQMPHCKTWLGWGVDKEKANPKKYKQLNERIASRFEFENLLPTLSFEKNEEVMYLDVRDNLIKEAIVSYVHKKDNMLGFVRLKNNKGSWNTEIKWISKIG